MATESRPIRPWWMTGLLVFCAFMTFVYVPWDLFLKPVARDEEVWFGFRFHGHAAKLLALPHWAVYAAGMVGFLRMRRWMWPWAAVYGAQVTLAMVVWPLLYVDGAKAIASAVVSGLLFGGVTWLLWRARPLFRPERPRFRDRYGEWALVTGASSGIGREFARALAREGCSIVLSARREERLRELAGELERESAVRTRVVPLDLERAGAAEELARAVSDLEVGILVNNAGFGSIGPLVNQPAERVRAMVELNCTAPALLARLALPSMLARRRGAIIFVGSVAGMVPMPLHALYGATKAFDNSLGEALYEELRGSGIDVLALEPGSTETEFQMRAGEAPHGGESSERVVAKALAALGERPSLVSRSFDWIAVNVGLRLLSRETLIAGVRRAAERRLPK